jgi:hypothetical protein
VSSGGQGSSATEIDAFGDRHRWSLIFDEDLATFRSNIYEASENTHDVIVILHVDGKRELVRSEVKVVRTSL